MHARLFASLLLTTTLFTACSDDEGADGSDLSGTADQGIGDLTMANGPDLAQCTFKTFFGLPGGEDVQSFACPCGCLIDGLVGEDISSNWSVVTSANGTATAKGAEGVELAVTSFGLVEFAGISSVAGTNPFFLDGDFELSVDYVVDTLAPDARVRLITQTAGGPPTGTFVVERVRNVDGVDRYAGLTGEVPGTILATDKTEGTLTLRRLGATFTALADGETIGQLSGGSVARLHIIVTTGTRSCGVDAGSCRAAVRIKNLRLATGTLINQR